MIAASNGSMGEGKALRQMRGRLRVTGIRCALFSQIRPGPALIGMVSTSVLKGRDNYSFIVNLKNNDTVSTTGTVTFTVAGPNSL